MTAVEFLVDELNKEMGLISFVTGTEESYKSAIFSIIEQAKEMEKEQIIEAVYHTCSAMLHSDISCGEQYYNETFNYEPNKCYHPLTERKHTSDTHFECTICGYNNY